MSVGLENLRNALMFDLFARSKVFLTNDRGLVGPEVLEKLYEDVPFDKVFLKHKADFKDFCFDNEFFEVDLGWSHQRCAEQLGGFELSAIKDLAVQRRFLALSAQYCGKDAAGIAQSGSGAIPFVLDALIDCLPEREVASFDDSIELAFVDDEEARTALRSDYDELRLCLKAHAYKASVVLAGSMVENILACLLNACCSAKQASLCSLLRAQDGAKPAKEPLARILMKLEQGEESERGVYALDLAALILCVGKLSLLAKELEADCTTMREFRNLIHPGRHLKKLAGRPIGRGMALRAHACVVSLGEIPNPR